MTLKHPLSLKMKSVHHKEWMDAFHGWSLVRRLEAELGSDVTASTMFNMLTIVDIYIYGNLMVIQATLLSD